MTMDFLTDSVPFLLWILVKTSRSFSNLMLLSAPKCSPFTLAHPLSAPEDRWVCGVTPMALQFSLVHGKSQQDMEQEE